jgi:hypothetical protein
MYKYKPETLGAKGSARKTPVKARLNTMDETSEDGGEMDRDTDALMDNPGETAHTPKKRPARGSSKVRII